MHGSSLASNDICSLPNRISSSCRPSLFLGGHFESSSLRARLVCNSPLQVWTRYPLHDLALLDDSLDLLDEKRAHTHYCPPLAIVPRISLFSAELVRTLFSDQGVVSVVGIVCVSCYRALAVADNSKVEFWEGVVVSEAALRGHKWNPYQPRNSCPNLPECPE